MGYICGNYGVAMELLWTRGGLEVDLIGRRNGLKSYWEGPYPVVKTK
jgi:hypothetical protein